MCDLHDHHGLPPLEADETCRHAVRPPLVATVRAQIDLATTAAMPASAIRPVFEQALTSRDWLPAEFQRDVPESGMGGGIGQWLLFRAADRSLCLFSLVVPPGSMTPVHDHLAWGLVGLYQGNQDEEFYDPQRRQHRARRGGVRSLPATTTCCCPRPTTSTACGRPRPRPRSRSTCWRTTPGAPSATPSTTAPERRGRFARATRTRSARRKRVS